MSESEAYTLKHHSDDEVGQLMHQLQQRMEVAIAAMIIQRPNGTWALSVPRDVDLDKLRDAVTHIDWSKAVPRR